MDNRGCTVAVVVCTCIKEFCFEVFILFTINIPLKDS